MKTIKYHLLTWALLLSAGALVAQTPIVSSKVPEPIRHDFSLRFHNAERVVWKKQGNDFIGAQFRLKESKGEAVYDAHGDWVQSTEEIEFVNLPDSARQYLIDRYPSHTAREVLQVSTRRYGILYEITIGRNQEYLHLTFDMNGKLIEVEEVEIGENASDRAPAAAGLKGKFTRFRKK